jgi:hypothetical protein
MAAMSKKGFIFSTTFIKLKFTQNRNVTKSNYMTGKIPQASLYEVRFSAKSYFVQT